MTIASLARVTVIGRADDKAALLEGLQALGCMHVTPMDGGSRTYGADVAPMGGTAISNARKALQFLNNAPYRRRQKTKDDDFAFYETVDQALALKTRLRVTADRRDFLEARVVDVEPWGEIDFSADGAPAGQYLWFYELPLGEREALETIDLPWTIVGKTHRVAYVVVISAQEPPANLLPVPRVHVGATPLAALRHELRETEIEYDDLVAERIALTRYIDLITSNLNAAEDAAALADVSNAAMEQGGLAALQGWVPRDQLAEVERFAAAEGLAFTAEAPTPGDEPPTLLRQPETRRAAVDLSLFYQVPNYRSWDPTLLILIFFPVFFAMILADAGYGLLMAVGLGGFWRRLGRTPAGRAYRRLGAWITAATILYGMLVGSYFGAGPPADGTLARFHLLAVNDFDSMMALSIGIGVMHVALANLMAAWAEIRAPDVLSKVGWVLMVAGTYALYLTGGASPAKAWLIAVMVAGALLVLLFSSKQRGVGVGGQARRLFDGVSALTGIMTAFGDVLSYMRLFALGLASASLAITFNQLATDAREAMPGLGVLAAVLILLLGHALNLALGIISGVVHGLRLNYIEFFKWGFDGEGTAFRAFAKKRVT